MSEDVLTVRGVRKTFEGENAPVRALRGADLSIASGEVVGVLGPPGGGTSTLVHRTGGRGPEGGQAVREPFRRLHSGGQTILMVTHDDDVAAAAGRIMQMRDGRVIDDGRSGAADATAAPATVGEP